MPREVGDAPVSYVDAVRPWYQFYAVTGSASATLIGLLFVAVSVGSGVFDADHQPGLRAFVSPSVVVFASVLAASVIALVPTSRWSVAGLLIAADGLFGMLYAGWVGWGMVKRGFLARIDLEDRIWYAALPAVAHAITVAASILLLRRDDGGCGVLAFSLGLLLIIGVRNAWDMTVWSITRRRE